MSTSPTRTHITTRSPVRGWKQLTFATGIAAALATSPAGGASASRDSSTFGVAVSGESSALTVEPRSSKATVPGGQSCGDLACVDNFMAACSEAGGTAVDVGLNPPVPNGVELECKTTSS